jgi:hypothetical protein
MNGEVAGEQLLTLRHCLMLGELVVELSCSCEIFVNKSSILNRTAHYITVRTNTERKGEEIEGQIII